MADQNSTSLQGVSFARPRIKKEIKFEFSLPIAIAIIDTSATASQNMVEIKQEIKQEPIDEIKDEISEESMANTSIYTDLYMMNEIEVMEDVCSTEFLENLPAGAQSEIETNTAASESNVKVKKANFFD
jgi:hypothetical protein